MTNSPVWTSVNLQLGYPAPGHVIDGIVRVADGLTYPAVTIGTNAEFRDTGPTLLGVGNFIFLPGCSATVAGDVVSYITANGLGTGVNDGAATTRWDGTPNSAYPLAIATAPIRSGQWGWYQTQGGAIVNVSGTVAPGDNAYFGQVGTLQSSTHGLGPQVAGAYASSANGVPESGKAIFTVSNPTVIPENIVNYTPEQFGAIGDGVAGTDSTPATGTDDSAAFQAALDHLVTQGGGILECGAKRYMLDLPDGQISADLSNITIRGIPGRTFFDFTRTVPWFNGAAGMDLVVADYGFIASSGSKYGGSTFNIASGTYSNSSGAVVLTTTAPIDFFVGAAVILTVTSGTGAWASLTGTYSSTFNVTTGTTVTVHAPIGLGVSTITGGTLQAVGTGIGLTNDTISQTAPAGRTLSGTRSGSTITLETDAAHGLTVGQLIWSLGDPALTGDELDELSTTQTCFYTVGGRAVGRSIPVEVASTPTTTSLTFEYTGDTTGMDTVMDLTSKAYVFHASDVVEVPDTSIFTRGERVLVGSLRERGRDTEHCNIGEYQIIGRILNSTLLRFQGNVRESYTVADGAIIFKLTQIMNPVIEGITFIGKGHNANTYNSNSVIQRGDACLVLQYTHNAIIRDCTFIDCDLMSALLFYTSKALVERNVIVFDQRDAAGASTGTIDIQYGFNFGAAVDDITFDSNTVFGGRHAIVQGGSSSQTDFGVARVARFLNNYCSGQWLEAMSTHQGADTLIYVGNHVTGARGGINPRYAKNIVIADNFLDCMYYGVVFFSDVINLLMTNNIIDAGVYPVWIQGIDNPTAAVITTGGPGGSASGKLSGPVPAGPAIQISGNQLRGGINGVYCIDTTAGLTVTGIEITDNSIYRSREEGIRVSIGSATEATDGWTGSINSNRFYGCGFRGTTYQVRLSNAKYVTMNNNVFSGTSAFLYALLIEGDGSTSCSIMGNTIPTTLYSSTVFAMSAMKGTGHMTDAVLREDVTISGGVAALRFASTRHLRLRMESGTADDLDSVTGAGIDQEVTMSTQATGWAITIKHGTGFELEGNADKLLDDRKDKIRFIWSTTDSKFVQTTPLMDHA